jgi:hypothetical protein
MFGKYNRVRRVVSLAILFPEVGNISVDYAGRFKTDEVKVGTFERNLITALGRSNPAAHRTSLDHPWNKLRYYLGKR